MLSIKLKTENDTTTCHGTHEHNRSNIMPYKTQFMAHKTGCDHTKRSANAIYNIL